jgi:hypothetical protein
MGNIKKPNESNKPGGKSANFGNKLKSLIQNSNNTIKDLRKKIGAKRGR